MYIYVCVYIYIWGMYMYIYIWGGGKMSIRESSQESYNALNAAYFSSSGSGDVCAAGGRSLS